MQSLPRRHVLHWRKCRTAGVSGWRVLPAADGDANHVPWRQLLPAGIVQPHRLPGRIILSAAIGIPIALPSGLLLSARLRDAGAMSRGLFLPGWDDHTASVPGRVLLSAHIVQSNRLPSWKVLSGGKRVCHHMSGWSVLSVPGVIADAVSGGLVPAKLRSDRLPGRTTRQFRQQSGFDARYAVRARLLPTTCRTDDV